MGDTETYDDKLRALETDRARHMPPGLLLHRSGTQDGGKSDPATCKKHLLTSARLPLAVERHALQVLDRIVFEPVQLALYFNGGKKSGPDAPHHPQLDTRDEARAIAMTAARYTATGACTKRLSTHVSQSIVEHAWRLVLRPELLQLHDAWCEEPVLTSTFS